ncbi:unnamed protein product [Cuscuta epithymum]|uniref:Uncharacterized protein n=1 Tax=Cuscuta epithymum TaxID=186058 RepID=A0AAV0GKB7_9ASTE|nr:unnamed protein product [Cuscuta epithymum]
MSLLPPSLSASMEYQAAPIDGLTGNFSLFSRTLCVVSANLGKALRPRDSTFSCAQRPQDSTFSGNTITPPLTLILSANKYDGFVFFKLKWDPST